MGRRLSSKLKKFILHFITIISFTEVALGEGKCERVLRDCIEPAEERIVDGFKVYRDCWRYKDAYRCSGYAKNDCEIYDDEGYCHLENTDCKRQVGDWCVAQNRIYKCEAEEKYLKKEKRYKIPTFQKNSKEEVNTIRCNKSIKCIDGSCFKHSHQENDEINAAAGMLATLRSMQGEYSLQYSIFRGENRKCSLKAFGLNKCCSPSNKSFVETIGLSSCDAGEKELIQLKNANKCNYIGSYKKKIMGVMQKKTHSYCCYESKIAKEINVQARQKGLINKGFGSPENPDCSGLTIEELQNINFEKIDFNFLSEEIARNNIWNTKGSMANALNYTKQLIEGEIDTIKNDVESRGGGEGYDEQILFEKKFSEIHNDPSTQKAPDGRDISRDAVDKNVLYNKEEYQNRDGNGL